MADYRYVQKGRSAYGVALTVFVAALGVGMLLSGDKLFVVIGGFFCILALSGVWAFLRKEEWSLEVIDGVLSWSYARWPQSHGRISLADVKAVRIDDCSAWLSFTLVDDTKQKIKLLGSGVRLREYFQTEFPRITITFIEGT